MLFSSLQDSGKKTDTMANVSIFCNNFFNWLEIEKYAFSFDIHPLLDQSTCGNNYISVVINSNQLKKLPQKIDTLAIVSNFLPESSTCMIYQRGRSAFAVKHEMLWVAIIQTLQINPQRISLDNLVAPDRWHTLKRGLLRTFKYIVKKMDTMNLVV